MKLTLGAALAILASPMAVIAAAVPDTPATESQTIPEPAVTTGVASVHHEEGPWPPVQINANYTHFRDLYTTGAFMPLNETEETGLATRSPMNCGLFAIWTHNWHEAGYRRYRVEAWAYGGQWGTTFWMLNKWCELFWNHVKTPFGHPQPGLVNPQCHVTAENAAFADISSFEGSHGHGIYTNLHQEVVNDWRYWTRYNCDVFSDF